MSATVIPFRSPNGTTARDLDDVRRVLADAAGWSVELVQGDAPWIAATGPDGAAWAILKAAGRFVAAPEHGGRAGFEGIATAADAARVVRQAVDAVGAV